MVEGFSLILPNGVSHPYSVVYSKRAKYIRIKLSQQGKLSVTLPHRMGENSAHEFIFSKANWVLKNLEKVKHEEQKIPQSLDLKLLGEHWSIQYVDSDGLDHRTIKCIEKKDQLLQLTGTQQSLDDFSLVSTVLNKWCRKKAKNIFNQMLQNLAELHGFHYHRLSIRTQKTRWGSCSNKKNINLNSKLLFMPEEVVQYVMIHELCHTVEMNHSSRFWALVEECDIHYMQHKRRLSALAKDIVI